MIIKKKKILFAAYGGGHIKVLLPVVQELLRENGAFEPVVLAFTTAKNDCKARCIACQTMLDFVHLFPPQAIEIGQKLASELAYHAIDVEESAAYLGISFWELVQEFGEEEAYKLYREKGRSVFCPVKAMEKILAELKPDMVVSTNSPRCEKALLKAANNLGATSICVADFYVDKTATWLAEDWCGTKICVLDEFVKQQLIDIGRNPAQIIITGNPAFDHYGSKSAQEEAEKYRTENIRPYSKIIAYASNTEPDGETKNLPQLILDFLVKECKRLGYRLSHRQHPSEAVATRPEEVLNGNAVSLETFISSADLMVTFPSTVIYEARLLAVPTLALGMSGWMYISGYLAAGKYSIASNFEEISMVLEQLGERVKKLDLLKNKATNAVIEVIKGIDV